MSEFKITSIEIDYKDGHKVEGRMADRLEEGLRRQAEELGDNGEEVYGPADESAEALRAFQDDFRRLLQYEREGLLKIIGAPRRVSMSEQKYVVRVRVRLTREGVKRWGKS